MIPSIYGTHPDSSARPAFVFVFEQALSHAMHGDNIERAVRRDFGVDASVLRLGHRENRLASRLPAFGSWSFEASWGARTALRRHLEHQRPDALFIHTQVASLLSVGIMRRVPTVISLDATPVNYDSVGASYGHRRQIGPVEWAKREVNRRALAAARAIVTFSQWAADSVVRDYGIAEHRVRVIRPGVDLSRFRPGPEGEEGERARILFVGGDFVRKGGTDLLDALSMLGESAELDIVTATPPTSIPPGARVRVHLGLNHDSEELFELYRQADIFALPTTADCSPHVISEAIACGLPVVACNVGAIPEMVVDGHNGLLVPAGSRSRLGDALTTLVNRPDLRREMRANGLLMARRDLDGARNAEALFALMKELAHAGRSRKALS